MFLAAVSKFVSVAAKIWQLRHTLSAGMLSRQISAGTGMERKGQPTYCGARYFFRALKSSS